MKHLLKHLDEIRNRSFLLLLDYDGTLTPIVLRPELAVLSEDMRDVLKKIAEKYPTAIISGRAIDDVKNMVKVENIYYAGNHGFEISNDRKLANPDAEKTRVVINEICRKMQKNLIHIKGSIVENKGITASVHYRMVSDNDFLELTKIFKEVIAPYLEKGEIKITSGKKVFELRPNIEWNKGKAVEWVIDAIGKEGTPVYIGDDRTDEDAFTALRNKGVTVLVSEKTGKTNAKYYLRNVDEVKIFLEGLL